MSVQDDDSARGASLPPIDVPALLGRFREGYGIGQLSAWCGHGQGAIEDVLRAALRGPEMTMEQLFEELSKRVRAHLERTKDMPNDWRAELEAMFEDEPAPPAARETDPC